MSEAETLPPTVTPKRVVVVSAEPMTRFGLQRMIETTDGCIFSGEGESIEAVFPLLKTDSVDLLILDPVLRHKKWVEPLAALLEEALSFQVLLLTRPMAIEDVILAYEMGVRGIVAKTSSLDELKTAIITVLDGFYWNAREGKCRNINRITARLKAELEKLAGQRKGYGLTAREYEVIDALLDGMANTEMAQHFKISEDTVKRHLFNIFDKTGVSTRLELAIFAINHGLSAEYQRRNTAA